MSEAPMSVLTETGDNPLAALDTDEQRLDFIIEHLESTAADDWQTDVVRRDDPNGITRNCFFGHLYDLAGGDDPFPVESRYRPETCGSYWWNWFENRWATTFRLYPINDGQDSEYPQPTAKDRVIAFLRDLRSGQQLATEASMDASYELHAASEISASEISATEVDSTESSSSDADTTQPKD